jgi:D-alanyl-D-alanine carboxypeptidase
MMTRSLPGRAVCIRIRWKLVNWLLPLLLLAGGLASAAHAAKPVTWIVMDASTGRVLTQHESDSLNYPASLTKMMTLYLTFDALRRHQITLDTRFAVSHHAASMEPTKIDLVPGQTISIRKLILSIVTQSANDSAVVLAEGLAGSEEQFAARMNAEARMLGMSSTNFRNASGLPNRYNYSTARDICTLALALYRNFPQYYHFFSTENFTYDGRSYHNHNHLLAVYPGMDGLKTGFIDASGFNLAASAVRDHRRLVGVIMGGRSWHSRDMEMAALLNAAFINDGVPASLIAATDPARLAHDRMFQRDVAQITPMAARVALADARPAPAAPVVAATRAVAIEHFSHLREPYRHELALRHETRRVHYRRIVWDRHHHRRHERIAATHRRERLNELARRAREHRAQERLALRREHRRALDRLIAKRERRAHDRRLAEARPHHGRRYAALHRRHHHVVRREARLVRHASHRHHAVVARLHPRRVLQHYAALHRQHPHRRIYRTASWTCSPWAMRHHRCPGGRLKLPHSMVKSADNARGVGGSSS